jgi:hypothetical protein
MNEIKVYTFPKACDLPQEGDEYLGLRASETWTKIPNPLKQSAYDENDVGYVRRPLKLLSQTALIEELEDLNHVTGIRKDILCGSTFRIAQNNVGPSQPIPVVPKTVPFSIANIKNAEHCSQSWEKERVVALVSEDTENLSKAIAKMGRRTKK